MARQKHSELAAGVFMLLALGAGVGVLLWLGAAEMFATRGDQVFFVTPYASGNLGLEVGSAVKVTDKTIGKIEDITLDLAAKRVLYVARLDRRDIKIHKDARAMAVGEFLGGASVVLDDFGSESAPPADERNPVALVGTSVMIRQIQEALGYGEDQREQFQQTLARMAEIAGNMRDITGALGAEMGDDDPTNLLPQVKAAVAKLRVSSEKLAEMTTALRAELDKSDPDSLLATVRRASTHVEEGSKRAATVTKRLEAETEAKDPDSLLAKVRASADNVKEVTADAAGMMRTVRPDVEKTIAGARQYTEKDLAEILTNFRKASTDLVTIAADLRAVSATSKDIVVLNRDRIDDTLANLTSMSRNLNAAAKEIRRNPWRLLHRPDEQQTRSENFYDAARAFAEGAGQLEDALTRLGALREARPEGVAADDPDLIKIRKHVEATFEKFRKVEDALWEELTK